MKEEPLVSVCIPTFNGEKYIAEALDSVFSQSYKNLEIIVSDDDSTDGTLEIVQDYRNQGIPMRIFSHQPKGIGANWNNCLRHAKGKYVKFLFQDDVMLPKCIEAMVLLLEKDNGLGLVASKRKFIIEGDYLNDKTKEWVEKYNDLQKTFVKDQSAEITFIDNSLFKMDAFFKSPLNKIGEPSVVMFRRDLCRRIGFFRTDLRQILDYEFFYRILKSNRIGIINKSLVKFRLHNNQATIKNRGNDSQDYDIYHRIIYDEYLKYLNKEMRNKMLQKYNLWYRIVQRFGINLSK